MECLFSKKQCLLLKNGWGQISAPPDHMQSEWMPELRPLAFSQHLAVSRESIHQVYESILSPLEDTGCHHELLVMSQMVTTAKQSLAHTHSTLKALEGKFGTMKNSFVCRFHGSSPQNVPLGSRDVRLSLHRLYQVDWIPEAAQLWPFRENEGNFQLAYVYMDEPQTASRGQTVPLFHFILSYAVDPERCPILIRQSVVAIEDDATFEEAWAWDIHEQSLVGDLYSLDQRRFWTFTDLRPFIHRVRHSQSWLRGECVEIQILTQSRIEMLRVALSLSHRQGQAEQNHPPSLEFTSLLQKRMKMQRVHGFEEMCEQLLQRDHYDKREPGCYRDRTHDQFHPGHLAKPEDNSDLRTALSHGAGTKATISLSDTLSVDGPKVDLDKQVFQVLDRDDWYDAMTQTWDHPLEWLPEGMHIHASTWEALHTQEPHEIFEIQKMEIFVDGATNGRSAAWAVVVVTTSSCGEQLRGCIAGRVCTNADEVQWIGADRETNITAEISALIVAQAYAATIPSCIPVVIRPDLSLSRQIVEVHTTLKKYPIMNAISGCLAETCGSHVQVEEVRAHKSHAWNELADCVAKHVARTDVQVGKVNWEPMHHLAQSQTDRDWMWLQVAQPQMQQVMPPLFDGMVIQLPEETTEPKSKDY